MPETFNLNELTIEEQKNIILDALKMPGGLEALISKYSVLEQNPFENINIHTGEDSFYFELMSHIFELSKLEDRDAIDTPFCKFVMECLIDSFAQATPNLGKERVHFELRNWHFFSLIHSLGIESLLDKALFQGKLYVDWLNETRHIYLDSDNPNRFGLINTVELTTLRRIFNYQNSLEGLDLNQKIPSIFELYKNRVSDLVFNTFAPISIDAISSALSTKSELNNREFLYSLSNMISSFDSIINQIDTRFKHIPIWRELKPELVKLNSIGLFEFYNFELPFSSRFREVFNNMNHVMCMLDNNIDYEELPELEMSV